MRIRNTFFFTLLVSLLATPMAWAQNPDAQGQYTVSSSLASGANTLQAAVDLVNSGGGTVSKIVFDPAVTTITLSQAIQLDHPVEILGAQSGNSFIPNIDFQGLAGSGIVVNADGVTLMDLTVTGAEVGVSLKGDQGTVDRLTIQSSTDAAIEISGQQATVVNSTLEGSASGDGIRFAEYGSSPFDILIKDNQIRNNGGHGIVSDLAGTFHPGKVAIKDNVIFGNTDTDIHFEKTDHDRESYTQEEIDPETGQQITVTYYTTGLDIQSNLIGLDEAYAVSGTQTLAIYMGHALNSFNISGNTVSGGIQVDVKDCGGCDAYMTVANNTIGYAVETVEVSQGVFDKTLHQLGGAADGIAVTLSEAYSWPGSLYIKDNKVAGTADGISLDLSNITDKETVVVEYNQVGLDYSDGYDGENIKIGATGAGISISGGNSLLLVRNNTVKNASKGIEATGQDGSVFQFNNLTGNTLSGLEISNSTEVEILGGDYSGNGADGIYLGQVDKFFIDQASCDNNLSDGIEVNGCTPPVNEHSSIFRSNVSSSAGGKAVNLVNSSKIEVSQTILRGTGVSGSGIHLNNANTPRVNLPSIAASADLDYDTKTREGTVTGTSDCADCTVELFISAGGQDNADMYVAPKDLLVKTDANGDWSYTFIKPTNSGSSCWHSLMATVTDISHNTSPLSLIKVYDKRETFFDFTAEQSASGHTITLTSGPENGVLDGPNAYVYWTSQVSGTTTFQVAPTKNTPEGIRPDWDNAAALSPSGSSANLFDASLPAYAPYRNYYYRVAVEEQPGQLAYSEVRKFQVSPQGSFYKVDVNYLDNDEQHTNDINWVYEVSYLENGFSSQSITYIDGLGKVRQVQGLANSVGVMCSEVAYSEEGGGAVRSMAAPLFNTDGSSVQKFGYNHRFFDVVDATTGKPRDFGTEDFDRQLADGTPVVGSQIEVDVNNKKGVGFYYSDVNDLEPMVDDAEGYTYAYGLRKKDPLGLPLYGTSVGKDFQLGGGHESLVTYDQISRAENSKELRRIWGDNVPAEEVFVTTTLDANRMGYITYTDAAGKVLATALNGCQSNGLERLDEHGMDNFLDVKDVLSGRTFDIGTMESVAQETFTVDCNDATVWLDYTIDAKTFPIIDPSCAFCEYEIEVTVTRAETGEVVKEYTHELAKPAGFDGGASCPDVTSQNVTLIDSQTDGELTALDPGEYVIKRTVRPLTDPVTGENVLDKTIRETVEGIMNDGTLYDEFLTENYSNEDFYLLRQKETEKNRNVNIEYFPEELKTFKTLDHTTAHTGDYYYPMSPTFSRVAVDNDGSVYFTQNNVSGVKEIVKKKDGMETVVYTLDQDWFVSAMDVRDGRIVFAQYDIYRENLKMVSIEADGNVYMMMDVGVLQGASVHLTKPLDGNFSQFNYRYITAIEIGGDKKVYVHTQVCSIEILVVISENSDPENQNYSNENGTALVRHGRENEVYQQLKFDQENNRLWLSNHEGIRYFDLPLNDNWPGGNNTINQIISKTDFEDFAGVGSFSGSFTKIGNRLILGTKGQGLVEYDINKDKLTWLVNSSGDPTQDGPLRDANVSSQSNASMDVDAEGRIYFESSTDVNGGLNAIRYIEPAYQKLIEGCPAQPAQADLKLTKDNLPETNTNPADYEYVLKMDGEVVNKVESDGFFYDTWMPFDYDADLDEGLLVHFPFENGTVEDLGSEQQGFVKSGTDVFVENRFGVQNDAFDFQLGNYSNINLNDGYLSEEIKGLAYSVWFKSGDFDFENQAILGKWTTAGAGTEIFIGTDGRLTFSLYNSMSSEIASHQRYQWVDMKSKRVDDDQWHHLVMNAGNGVLDFYLDDQKVSSWEIAPVTEYYKDQYGNRLMFTKDFIGTHSVTSSRFDGELDDFRIYGRKLSRKEVSTLYDPGMVPTLTSIVENANTTNQTWTFDAGNSDGTSENLNLLSQDGGNYAADNGHKFELVAREKDNPSNEYVLYSEWSHSGMNEGECEQLLWHADKVRIVPYEGTNPNYTHQVIDADAKSYTRDESNNIVWGEVSGLETYGYAGYANEDPENGLEDITANFTAQQLQDIENKFLYALSRDQWKDLDPADVSINVYSFGVGDLTTSFIQPGTSDGLGSMPMLTDGQTLKQNGNSIENGLFYFLKVSYPPQSCDDECSRSREDLSSCEDRCLEQRQYLIEDLAEKKQAFATDNASFTLTGLGYSGADIVGAQYPLGMADEAALLLQDEGIYDAYIDVKIADEAVEAYEIESCVYICEGNTIPPCELCAENNITEQLDLARKIDEGIDKLVALWEANGSFPYADVDWTNDAEVDAVSEEVGSIIAAYLAKYHAAGTTSTDLSMWTRIYPIEDYTLKTPADAANGCQEGEEKYVFKGEVKNLMTLIFIDKIFLSEIGYNYEESYANCLNQSPDNFPQAKCRENLESCVGTLNDENETATFPQYETIEVDGYPHVTYLGSTVTSFDPEGMYEVDQSTPSVADIESCLAKFDCKNASDPIEYDKRYEIERVVLRFYNTRQEIDDEVDRIMAQHGDKDFGELMIYLSDYELHKECVSECETGRWQEFKDWRDDLIHETTNTIRENYLSACFSNMQESFTVKYQKNRYHYTLFNYDKAGNLLSTVPPEGVDILSDAEMLADGTNTRQPDHWMQSDYVYNSLGELQFSNHPDLGDVELKKTNPDHGRTRFLYDVAGRVRFSQTEEQRRRGTQDNKVYFSYTKYDEETGRILEVGEYGAVYNSNTGSVSGFDRQDAPGVSQQVLFASDFVNDIAWPQLGNWTHEESFFHYDEAITVNGNQQTYIDHRVSHVENEHGATYFSYDVHGRVKWSVQEVKELAGTGHQYKKVEYDYEPISSLIKKSYFQKGVAGEQMVHRFTYDEDLRVKKVELSKDDVNFTAVSQTEYYKHGPVKNVVMGEDLQQIDLVYNIQGWLKAINDPTDNSAQGSVAPDVFSEVLHYYSAHGGDYKRTDASGNKYFTEVTPGASSYLKAPAPTGQQDIAPDLFNGNISGTVTANGFSMVGQTTTKDVLVQGFRYDELNRLVRSHVETYDRPTTGNALAFMTTAPTENLDDIFSVDISYDPNGNIESLTRKADKLTVAEDGSTQPRSFTNGNGGALVSGTQMDEMVYKYLTETHSASGRERKRNNRLQHVIDTYDDPELEDIKGVASTTYSADRRETPQLGLKEGNGVIEVTMAGITYWFRPTSEDWKVQSVNPNELIVEGGVFTVEGTALPGMLITNDVDLVLNGTVSANAPLMDLTDTRVFVNGDLTFPSTISSNLNNTNTSWEVYGSIDFTYGVECRDVMRVYGEVTSGSTFHIVLNDLEMYESSSLTANTVRVDYARVIGRENGVYATITATNRTELYSSELTGALYFDTPFFNNVYGGSQIGSQVKVNEAPAQNSGTYAYDPANPVSHNFAYDYDGNIVRDAENDISKIEWNAMGLVKEVIRMPGSEKPNLYFKYDAGGNRLVKEVVYTNDPTRNKKSYYIGGSIYTEKWSDGTNSYELSLEEQSIVGGTYKHLEGKDLSTLQAVNEQLRYELKDHLGNVRAVIMGAKNAQQEVQITYMADYYPFGMVMPGREYVDGEEAYRYGYNGMERDEEFKGSGNSYTTAFRQYDARLGRWLSVDPIYSLYPSLTPYMGMNGNPVLFTDRHGLSVETKQKGGGNNHPNGKTDPPSSINWSSDNPLTQKEKTSIVYGLTPSTFTLWYQPVKKDGMYIKILPVTDPTDPNYNENWIGGYGWYYVGDAPDGYTPEDFNDLGIYSLNQVVEGESKILEAYKKALAEAKKAQQVRELLEARRHYALTRNIWYLYANFGNPVSGAILGVKDSYELFEGGHTALAVVSFMAVLADMDEVARGLAARGVVADMWSAHPCIRGKALEFYLAPIRYSKFLHTDTYGRFFPTIDFINSDGLAVSLKTVNAKGPTADFSNILKNVNKLSALKEVGFINYNGFASKVNDVRLDIAIPAGYKNTNLDAVVKYAKSVLGEENVKVFTVQ